MPPSLFIHPLTDETFVSLCRELVADSGSDPGLLERALRATYPEAVVRPRELSGETMEVWYVYRDGRWKSAP